MQDPAHSGLPSLDVATATRFISSLSKSLQALCHGCMDFDAGIEIVGFINVNIDNGSKVDYVLNEKVSKCANNSMTFVSNSFLAKKEQPKQTRDGACSPVQELMVPVPSSSHHGYKHPQQSHKYPYSSHLQAQGLRPHKRSWSGSDRLRGSPRKQFRGGRSTWNPTHPLAAGNASFGSPGFAGSPSTLVMQNQQSDTQINSSQVPGYKCNNECVDVKKEAFESEHLDNKDSSNSFGLDSKLNFDIKPDPESAPNQDEPVSSENFSDNFLNNQSDPYSQPQQVSEQSEDASDSNMPTTSSIANHPTYPDSDSHLQSGPSDTHHTNTSANNSGQGHYPQSSSGQEAGASMDESGGFDVIEIGDEDEDLQTVFGDNQCIDEGSYFQTSEEKQQYHQQFLPFNCRVCPKSFSSRAGLKQHAKCHMDPRFVCTDCGAMYKYRHHLKRHRVAVHPFTVLQ